MTNDDGGGIRLLQPRDDAITITNNMIVNNISTDFGAGIALDDASNVSIVNNTIARNVNTSTAFDSDNQPHGAGIIAEAYSAAFEATLPVTNPGHPDPVMFNNIICENKSFEWDSVNAVLVDPGEFFDLEVFSAVPTHEFHPTESLLTDPTNGGSLTEDFASHPTLDACGSLASLFVDPYEVTLGAAPFRVERDFVFVNIATVFLPATVIGDYHINAASVAEDEGVISDPLGSGVLAPCEDIDGASRPNVAWDLGADEVGAGNGTCSPGGPTLGVDIAPPDVDIISEAGVVATINHQIVNTGDTADIYDLTASVDLGWGAVVVPATTSSIAAGGSENVVVEVTIPGGVADGTVANVTVVATSQTNGAVSDTTVDTITIQSVVTIPAADWYMSFEVTTNPLVNLGAVRDEDIVGYIEATGNYVRVFDGSDVGIPNNVEIDGFDILEDGSILMSFQRPTTIPGVGAVDDSDILLFTPTAPNGLGATTSGTFSMFLDGSTVGLTSSGEDIDGLQLFESDKLLISTRGNVSVSGASGSDEDIMLFEMSDANDPSLGGTWSRYFDGSTMFLNDGNNEDVNGFYATEDSVYLTTDGTGTFVVPGVSGVNEDVFVCNVLTTGGAAGGPTSCNYDPFFVGASNGIPANQDINGFDVGFP